MRPIHQIQGNEEFPEILLGNVRIPVGERVGEKGAGNAVAQSTLASERGLTVMELAYRMLGNLFRLADTIRAPGLAEDGGIQRGHAGLCGLRSGRLFPEGKGERAGGRRKCLGVKNACSRALRAWAELGLRMGMRDIARR